MIQDAKVTTPNIRITTQGSTPQISGSSQERDTDGSKSSDEDITTLLPDDINFPKLQIPVRSLSNPNAHNPPVQQTPTQRTLEKTPGPMFVWGPKPTPVEQLQTPKVPKEKGVAKPSTSTQKFPDSTPITRQGYWTGRLAEDFWSALGIPNPPPPARKTLQVIPFLTKNPQTEQVEYLADNKTFPSSAIVQVHIAELLAGIPWTTIRARQHIVNEVSLALNKVLIFNNNLSNPFQKWQQGSWFASWEEGPEGEHTCTLFVSVSVIDQRVKPRKGQNFRWQQVPGVIRDQLTTHTADTIIPATEHTHWYTMAGKPQDNSKTHVQEPSSTATSNAEESPSAAVNPPPQYAG